MSARKKLPSTQSTKRRHKKLFVTSKVLTRASPPKITDQQKYACMDLQLNQLSQNKIAFPHKKLGNGMTNTRAERTYILLVNFFSLVKN